MHVLSLHRRRLHRIVWLILTAWVFALLCGVIHACLLTSSPELRSGLVQLISIEAAAHDLHKLTSEHRSPAELGPASNQTPDDRSAASDSCEKFCNNEASSLSKNLSSPAELPVSLVVVSDRWPQVVQSIFSTARWTHWQASAHGPPLVFRFLRLTL